MSRRFGLALSSDASTAPAAPPAATLPRSTSTASTAAAAAAARATADELNFVELDYGYSQAFDYQADTDDMALVCRASVCLSVCLSVCASLCLALVIG